MIADYFTMTFDEMPKGTAQMKRYDGRSGHYFKSKRLQQTEDIYLTELEKYKPEHPIEGAVAVNIWFEYEIKAKKKRGTWKTSRPDVDNVAKLLIDCMTKVGYWKDDSQIVKLNLRKSYSRTESAEITISYWEEFDDE